MLFPTHKQIISACIAAIVINALFLKLPILGVILMATYLYATGTLAGNLIAPNHSKSERLFYGSLAVHTSTIITGTIFYYLIPIPLFFILCLTIAPGVITLFFPEPTDQHHPHPKLSLTTGLLILTFIAGLTAWWIPLLDTNITTAVRSPWNVIDFRSVIGIAIAAFSLTILSLKKSPQRVIVTGSALILFSMLAVGFAAYPIGYGFDPFIHRATVLHIAEHGTITPKPLYYIGQYILELIAVHSFTLPLKAFDSIIVPALASVLLSISAFFGFKAITSKPGAAVLSLLLLPLGAFVMSTPQGLAYAFTGSLLFLSIPRLIKKISPPWSILVLLTLTAVMIHPLAGIPAALYFVLLIFTTLPVEQGTKTVLIILLALLSAVALPLVFFIQAKLTGLDITPTISHLFSREAFALTSFFANRFNPIFDLFYLVSENQLLVSSLLAVVGSMLAYRHRLPLTFHLPLFGAILWFINYWLLNGALEFSFLIEYERSDYAERLLILTQIFLLPAVAYLFLQIAENLSRRPAILGTTFALLLALIASSQVYGAYPRDDGYSRSAGFNVSEADFHAVTAIADASRDEDYIVLANQAVSAAALETYGFKTYYKGSIFYYPIPTGGELYQKYLDMADVAPTREHAIEAMDIAGVNTAYFVLNDYWWRSEVIRERAKNEADEWFSIENSAVTVFVYRR